MRITVFGGSAPKANEPAYQEAYILGKLIAEAGHTVLNGGYIGTMEAVSRGAYEAGGHVIGVTCNEIEVWRPVAPNPWIKEEIRFATVRERMFKLIEGCDAAFALPGGVGTLAEIAVTWNQIQTLAISPRPLILIGVRWKEMFEGWFAVNGAYVPPVHRRLVTFAPDVHEAFNQLARLSGP
jgi:uncharacterized protein (TIGR00730 family)